MLFTDSTHRASLSLKSIPSATFPLKTAKKIAPDATRKDFDDDSLITSQYAFIIAGKSLLSRFLGSTKISFNFSSLLNVSLFFHLSSSLFIAR